MENKLKTQWPDQIGKRYSSSVDLRFRQRRLSIIIWTLKEEYLTLLLLLLMSIFDARLTK